MADSEAMAIVRATAALRMSHSNVGAVEILDLAMTGRHDSDPCFDDPSVPGGDWTDPQSQFGAVLGEAFGFVMTQEQLRDWGAHGPDETSAEKWQGVGTGSRCATTCGMSQKLRIPMKPPPNPIRCRHFQALGLLGCLGGGTYRKAWRL